LEHIKDEDDKEEILEFIKNKLENKDEDVNEIYESSKKQLELEKISEIQNDLLDEYYETAKETLETFKFEFYKERGLLLNLILELLEYHIDKSSENKINNIVKKLKYTKFTQEKDLSLFLKCIVSKCFKIDNLIEKCEYNLNIDIIYIKILETINCKQIFDYKLLRIDCIDENDLSKGLEIFNTLKDETNKFETLKNIISKICSNHMLVQIIEITNKSIEDKYYKFELLKEIVRKIEFNSLYDKEIFFKIIEIAKIIDGDDYDEDGYYSNYESELLEEIVQKLKEILKTYDDYIFISEIIKIANMIKNGKYQFELLIEIIKKTNDTSDSRIFYDILDVWIEEKYYKYKLFKEVLKKANYMLIIILEKLKSDYCDNCYHEVYKRKFELLEEIVRQTNNINIFYEILEIVKTTMDDYHDYSSYEEDKVKLLEEIILKLKKIIKETDDIETLFQIIEITNIMEHCYRCKSELLEEIELKLKNIITQTNDIEIFFKIMEIVKIISKFIFVSELVEKIVFRLQELLKPNDKNMFKIIKIADMIEDEIYKSDLLEEVIINTNDKDILIRVIEIANKIEDEDCSYGLLEEMVLKLKKMLKTNDKNTLIKVIEILYFIKNEEYKFRLLNEISQKLQEILEINGKDILVQIIKIANTIEYKKYIGLIIQNIKLEDLLQIDPNIDFYNAQGTATTPIIQAIATQDIDLLNKIIEQGADVNKETLEGALPLVQAIWINNKAKEIIQILLDNGAEINKIQSFANITPLMSSIVAEKEEIIELLLKNKANPDIKSGEYVRTPLHEAVIRENIEIVKLLLKNKADPNIAQEDGLTPLHSAVMKENEELVKLLLKYKANKELKNQNGETPKDIAIPKTKIYNMLFAKERLKKRLSIVLFIILIICLFFIVNKASGSN